MKTMFDINVVLDIVGCRRPFYDDSRAAFLKAVESGETPFLSAHAYPTIYYLLGGVATRKNRDIAMEWVFDSFRVSAIGPKEISAARGFGMSDFEDALVAAAAESAGCGLVITRNVADFAASPVKALSPTEYLNVE